MLFYVPVDAAHKIGPLDFFFDLTSRYESRRDIGFVSAGEEHRTNWLNRGRLGFDWMASDDTRVRVTYQYSHINTKDEDGNGGGLGLGPVFAPTGDWEDRIRQDISEAYLERKQGDSTLMLGRFSVQRDWLVGSNNWGEVGRAWTGAGVTDGQNDFFVGRLDLDTVGNSAGDQHLAYAGRDWGDQYGRTTIYYKLDRAAADSIYTVGHEWSRTMDTVQFRLNGAFQWGRTGGADMEAWAAVAKVIFNMGDKMHAYAGYSSASGGTDSDGTVRTFDDLYPSDHGRLGIMDLQALRNVQALSVGLGYQVSEDIGFMASYHSFKLYDEDDFWYNNRNNYGYAYGTGNGTNVGSEIDLSLHWTVQENLRLSGGFGIFDPGSFIQNAGGGNDNSTFMYVGVNFRY